MHLNWLMELVKREFWQLVTFLQFAVLEKFSWAVPDEHSVHLHCMHLFKRHKYLLFIDSLKLPHCSQLILGYKSVQQLYNFFLEVPHTLVANVGGTDSTLSKGLPYMGSVFFSSIVV